MLPVLQRLGDAYGFEFGSFFLYRLQGEALDGRCLDSFSSLIVILFVTPFIIQEIDASITIRQVSRLNYGVLFSPVRKVKLVSDIWSHIFDLHLPDITPANLHLQLPHCDNATLITAQERANRICENNRALFWNCTGNM